MNGINHFKRKAPSIIPKWQSIIISKWSACDKSEKNLPLICEDYHFEMNFNKKLSFRNPIASIWSMISFRNDGSKLPVFSKWYMTVTSKWRRKIFVSKIILVSAHPEKLRTKNTYQGPYGLIHGCERRKRHERECQYFDHQRSAKAERGTVQKMLRKMDTNACTLRQLPEP